MPVYEITLKGFDDTSRTDHLVKWIKAESLEEFVKWRTNISLNSFILSVRNLSFEFPGRNFDEGIDFVIGKDEQIKVDNWKRLSDAYSMNGLLLDTKK